MRTSGSAARVITQRHRAMQRAPRASASDSPPAGAPVVVAGFGGGLQPGQRPGQIVVATEVRVAGGAPGRAADPGRAGARRPAAARRLTTCVTGPIVSQPQRRARRRPAAASARGRAGRRHGVGLAGRAAAGHRPAPASPSSGSSSTRRATSCSTPACCATALRRLPDAAAHRPGARHAGPRRWRRASVLLAGPRSFCAGVERAIEIVAPGARAARRAGLRAPPDRPQHPRRRRPRGARRGVRRASSTRCRRAR